MGAPCQLPVRACVFPRPVRYVTYPVHSVYLACAGVAIYTLYDDTSHLHGVHQSYLPVRCAVCIQSVLLTRKEATLSPVRHIYTGYIPQGRSGRSLTLPCKLRLTYVVSHTVYISLARSLAHPGACRWCRPARRLGAPGCRPPECTDPPPPCEACRIIIYTVGDRAGRALNLLWPIISQVRVLGTLCWSYIRQ
jgi:hypothetical protein